MNQVFCYALNIKLLLRAINECQTQKFNNWSACLVSCDFGNLPVNWTFSQCICVSGMSVDITSGKKKSRNYK